MVGIHLAGKHPKEQWPNRSCQHQPHRVVMIIVLQCGRFHNKEALCFSKRLKLDSLDGPKSQ